MSFIQEILGFLRQLWPVEIVYSYQSGIRFWCGVDVDELDPGWYLFWPFFGRIEVMDTKPDVMRLANQDLTTKDAFGVTISMNVLYEINDARAAFCNVQKVTDNIADECRTAAANEVRRHNFADLLERQEAVETRIAYRVAKVAGEWGVQIHRVNFADFIRTKSISLASR
jgi:regulator of protease activity HflC (stomatin/prohibitin superfamily)